MDNSNQDQEALQQLAVILNELKTGQRRPRIPTIVGTRPTILAQAPEGMAAAGDARRVAIVPQIAPTQRKLTFSKLMRWTLKTFMAMLLLLSFISICSAIIWDFRHVEPQFAKLTSGILSPKYVSAITEWQLFLNRFAFGLHPKLPLNKFEEGSIWTKFTRVFGNY